MCFFKDLFVLPHQHLHRMQARIDSAEQSSLSQALQQDDHPKIQHIMHDIGYSSVSMLRLYQNHCFVQ
jgi:hypothetical protein